MTIRQATRSFAFAQDDKMKGTQDDKGMKGQDDKMKGAQDDNGGELLE